MAMHVGRGGGQRVAIVAAGGLGALGFVWGSFAVLLTDLSLSLQLAPARLGLALTVGMLASLPVMIVAGRVADRAGCGALLAGSGILLAVGFVGLAGVASYPALLLTVAVLSAASGAFDVGVNAAAVAWERDTGRRRMAVIQAAFSVGGAIGALAAGALLAVGVPFRAIYVADLLPLMALVLVVTRTEFPVPAESPEPDTGVGFSVNRRLCVIAAVAALAFLAESAMEQWSGVYLRTALGLPAFAGASGVAVYHASMAAGRLVCAGVIGRLGEVRTLRAAGLLTTGGMLVALASPAPVLVVTGFLMVGLALSAVLPTALTLTASTGSTAAGAASSLVTTISYGGFLLGPTLVGTLAGVTGLRGALGIITIIGVTIAALAASTIPGRPIRFAG